MRTAGRGAIVTLGSTNSFATFPLPAYGPGPTAILGLTRSSRSSSVGTGCG